MNNQHRELILGPPGTGKTTELIGIVEAELARGVAPEQIAYLSFTRAGANEAKERVVEKFGLPIKRFPYFRTLHSLAYFQLGLRQGMVLSNSDYKELGEMLSMEIQGNYAEDGKTGQLIKFIEEQHRTRKIPLEQALRELAPDSDISEYRLRQYKSTLDGFKDERGVLDFTAMIELAAKESHPLQVETFIVDEAQDLTPLEWDYVKRISANAKNVYFAGDDIQAIHSWSGASTELFLSLDVDKTRVLKQSYRLPKTIKDYCDTISQRISHQYKKEWIGRETEGEVNAVDYFELDNIDISEGSWFLLARNLRFLSDYEKLLRSKGVIYSRGGKGVYLEKLFKPIVYWERLRKGQSIMGADIKSIYDLFSSMDADQKSLKFIHAKTEYSLADLKSSFGLNTEKPWFDSMVNIPPRNRTYLQRCLKNGEKFNKPRAVVSSMHAVKGREADNVIMLPDMSHPTNMEYIRAPDNEHRVFYVGASRAREKLYLITPHTVRFYNL